MLKIRKSDYVLHAHFGALYVIGSYRDSSGSVYQGINGNDGITYCFNACEITKKLSYEEFIEKTK